MQMTNMRRALALAGATLMLGGLTACGGDESGQASTAEYCASVKAAQQELKTLQSGDPRNLEKAFSRIQDLADQAPPAVADEWRALDGALTGFEDALKKAGLGFGDLADPQSLQTLDPQQVRELGAQAQRLGAEKLAAANRAIQQHAQKACGIRLGGLG
jgi:hypothetical protein